MKIGLRVDVDTLRGTRTGLPRLQEMLDQRGIVGSFFLSVGPDNMGRHLRRLLSPAFLYKMIRSGAPSLYGWDILLRGTLWPGPIIHRRLGWCLRRLGDSPHELGTHAWDHHLWQVAVHRMSVDRIADQIEQAHEAIALAAGRLPSCVAAPGWRATQNVLQAQKRFGYRYASDCRGSGVFQATFDGEPVGPPQIPVNLPTWDEIIGTERCSRMDVYPAITSHIRNSDYNVLTIHAEAEGGSVAHDFEQFLDVLMDQGVSFVPLSDLMPERIEQGRIVRGWIGGRAGWVAQRAVEST